MVVTCPVWWFFVDLGTSNDRETGRTGRWKRRKVPPEKNERLRGREREGRERWVSSERKNTLAGPRQRPGEILRRLRCSQPRGCKNNILLWIPMASTCWCPTIPPPGRATWCTQSTRFHRIFHSFFAHSLPLSLSYPHYTLDLWKDQDDLHNRGHADSENRGGYNGRGDFSLSLFLSRQLVRCSGLLHGISAHLSVRDSSGLGWTMLDDVS